MPDNNNDNYNEVIADFTSWYESRKKELRDACSKGPADLEYAELKGQPGALLRDFLRQHLLIEALGPVRYWIDERLPELSLDIFNKWP